MHMYDLLVGGTHMHIARIHSVDLGSWVKKNVVLFSLSHGSIWVKCMHALRHYLSSPRLQYDDRDRLYYPKALRYPS